VRKHTHTLACAYQGGGGYPVESTRPRQIARAAEHLHLHPNSLSYRLDRWGTLTGWHPRTFDGLRKSVLAIGQQPRLITTSAVVRQNPGLGIS
jgi:hypothetical protein